MNPGRGQKPRLQRFPFGNRSHRVEVEEEDSGLTGLQRRILRLCMKVPHWELILMALGSSASNNDDGQEWVRNLKLRVESFRKRDL